MNAIILAAGMGTRLRPLTDDRPKCLVAVNGVPMIERQIQFLHEAGIRDITLVSGYKAEKLDYLRDKYGVEIVFNDRYDTCNNINSLYVVRHRFGDTFVVEGDIFMTENPFTTKLSRPAYFGAYRENYHNEWAFVTRPDGTLEHIEVGDGSGLIMSGVSYWDKASASVIAAEVTRLVETDPSHVDLFWDNAAINVLPRLTVDVRTLGGLYEIDTVAEHAALEKLLSR